MTDAKRRTDADREPAGESLSRCELPKYAGLLAARHAAHRVELRRQVDELWGGRSLEVLDVACGDGFYTAALAALLGRPSTVVAVDVLPAFLGWSANRIDLPRRAGVAVAFVQADAARLPFHDARFDLAWCAQSLISLPDPAAALREMRRVVRPGGMVAVLENDPLHDVQLPWPAGLELAVRTAERRYWASRRDVASPDEGRSLVGLLTEAGLPPIRRFSLQIERTAPLSPADLEFLTRYLAAQAERVADRLEPEDASAFQRLVAPGSTGFLPSQRSFWMIWNDLICLSKRE